MKNNTEKVCFLALFLGSICVNLSNAQDITLDVVNLTFYNSHSLRWAGTEPARDVKVPQWSELYSEQEPCAFTMSNRIFINFEYRLSKPWNGDHDHLRVRAMGTNGVNIFPFYCEPFIGDSTGEFINASSLQDAGVLTNNTIGCVNYELNWEYSIDLGDTWYSAGSTSNPCYITFDTPKAPWSSSQKCYVEMLWIACENMMMGCSSAEDALESLVISTYGWMTYEGSDDHYTYPYASGIYYIRDFINDSRPERGPTEGVDCRDFACFCDALAAAVGCESTSVKIEGVNRDPYPTFLTHDVKPSNLDIDQYNWEYHVFNRNPSDGDSVGDACIKLDCDSVDGNPFGIGDYVMYDIVFSSYLTRLSTVPVYSLGTWTSSTMTENSRQ